MTSALIDFRARMNAGDFARRDAAVDEDGESMPFADERFADAKSDDIRFADENTYKGQSFGNKERAEAAESQRLVDDLIPQIKRDHFDGDSIVNGISTSGAYRIFEQLESGRIDLRAQYGKDAANQVLIGELAIYARKLLSEGDPELYNLIEAKKNKAVDNEASAAARVLNALQFYTRELDKMSGIIRKAKTAVVEKMGKGTADYAGQVQVSFDAAIEAIKSFTPEERSVIQELVSKGRTDRATSQAENMAREFSGKKKPGAKVTSVMEEFAAAQESFLPGDVKFADESLTQQQKKEILNLLTKRVVLKGSIKLTRFVAELKRAGFAKEFFAEGYADKIYAQALEFHNKAKAAKVEDATAEKSKTEKAEPTFAEKWIAAMDESDAIADRINKKVKTVIERVKGAGKPRKTPQKSAEPIYQLGKDSLKAGDNYNRTETIKAAIKLGFTQKAADEFSDAVEAHIANQKALAETQRQENPSVIARRISKRFNNPQDRPPSKKEPIAQLVRLATNQKSTVTEASFMAQMKTFGVAQIDAANLWADIVKDRAIREQARELKKLADAEHADSPTEKEAKAIIKKLENGPGKGNPRVKSAVAQFYNDQIGFGKDRTEAEFVDGLTAAGVDAATATRLYELANIEKADRLNLAAKKKVEKVTATGKGFTPTVGPITLKRQVKADKRTVISLEQEILNHPMLRRVGEQMRLQIQARLFEERAGLSPKDAYAAALKFDEILKAKWIEAGERVVEKEVVSRNAPFFRKERGTGTGKKAPTGFDMLIRAIRAGALDPSKRILDDLARQQGWVDLSPGELQELARLDEMLHSGGLTPAQSDRLIELNRKERLDGPLSKEDAAEQKLLQDRKDEGLTDFEATKIRMAMLRLYQASSLPDDWKVKIAEKYKAAVFSGISTWNLAFSAIGNLTMGAGRDLALATAGSMANVLGKETSVGRFRNLAGMSIVLRNTLRNVSAAYTDAVLTLRTGQLTSVMPEEMQKSLQITDRAWDKAVADFTSSAEMAMDKSATSSQRAAAGAKALTSFSRALYWSDKFAFRIMSSLDSLVKGYFRRALSDLETFSRIAHFGWTKDQMRAILNNIYANQQAYAQDALALGFTNKNDIASYVNGRMENALAVRVKADDLKKAGVDLDVINRNSIAEAQMEVGMNEFQRGLIPLVGDSMIGLQKALQKNPLTGAVVAPVIRTPYNLWERSQWFSPTGLAMSAKVWRETKGWTEFDETKSFSSSAGSAEQAAMRLMEASIGTALFVGIGAAVLSQLGLDDDDPDKVLRITLKGPSKSDRLRYTAWWDGGGRPYTMQIKLFSDEWRTTVAFRRGGMEILNYTMTFLGAFDQMKHKPGENSFSKYLRVIIPELFGETFFPIRPYTRGNITFEGNWAGQELGYRLTPFSPWSGMLNTPYRFEEIREPGDSFGAAFLMATPITKWAQDRPYALNSMGRKIGVGDEHWAFIGSKIGLPVGFVKGVKPATKQSEVTERHITELWIDKGYFPTINTRETLEEQAGRPIDIKEWQGYAVNRGDAVYAKLKSNYFTYKAMEKDEFKKDVEKLVEKETKRAKRLIGIR
jgi:hypothetical protein